MLILALFATPAFAQVPFPARGVEIINELYAGVNPQDDGARRIAIHRVCAQMVAELGPMWGNKKRAGLSDDSRSPDSIAWRAGEGQPVSVWDIQASSGQILVFAGKPADYPNLPTSEAEFMPCSPMDYLHPAPPAPVPSPGVPVPVPPQAPPLDLSQLATKEDIRQLSQQIAAHHQWAVDKASAWENFVKSKWTYITSGVGVLLLERFNAFGTNPPAEVVK